jgi:prepilin-type N-terminal cleavage/methylation domain-containing protein
MLNGRINSHTNSLKSRRNAARAGFTIVELLTVVVLLGTTASMSMPKIADTVKRNTVHSARDQFALAHSLARATAIRYGRTAQLRINTSTAKFWIQVDTSTNATPHYATVGSAHELSLGGVTVTSDRATLCFGAQGLPTTGGTCDAGDISIVFSRQNRADTLRTTALGKVIR